jgi:hypothetical protein
MANSKVFALKVPEEADALSDILKQGAQALLRKAIETEVGV